MTPEFFESLLYSSESDTLDFKLCQYHFDDKEKKAEFLKDILAFANSWRKTDAYILIGVKDVPGGKSEVVGEESHPV